MLLIFRGGKTEAHYGSQDQTRLYLINWCVFGTLQARLLICCQTNVVIAANGLTLLDEFIFRLELSGLGGKVFNSEGKLQGFQDELRSATRRSQTKQRRHGVSKKEKECALCEAERKVEINHLVGAGSRKVFQSAYPLEKPWRHRHFCLTSNETDMMSEKLQKSHAFIEAECLKTASAQNLCRELKQSSPPPTKRILG